jgi:hypothetical protein
MALGMEIWNIFLDGYKPLETPPSNEVGNKNYHSNPRSLNSILGGLA